jgi:thiol:disulfide interchange protein
MTEKRPPSAHSLDPTDGEPLLPPDNADGNLSGFDQECENQFIAQIEAERAATAGAPTGLFMLMLAPLLLIAFPLLLLWFLRSQPATNTAAPTTPETTVTQAPPSAQSAASFKWQTSFDAALALAKKTGKPVMADFYADWCGPCKALDAYTWPDPSVTQEAQNFIPVKIDIDAPSNLPTVQRYGIRPIPCIIWIAPDGTEKGRNEGAVGPQDMLALMQQYR